MLAVAATIEATATTVPMTVLQGGDRGDESRNQRNARKAVAATLREESLAHVSETMIRLSEKLLEMEKLQIDDGGTTESPLDTMLQAVQQAIDGIGSK